jgi:aminopeptidase N
MLRRLVGDEVFWKGISTFYLRYRHGNALTVDFQRVMEEVSGRPLQAFFRQWVYTPGQPVVEGSWTYAGGVLTVELHQAQATDTVYATAIDIGIVTDRSAAPKVEVVQLDQRNQTFTIALDKEPVDVVLDPNTWLLMQAATFTRKDRAR